MRHIIPRFNVLPHVEDEKCWCKPEIVFFDKSGHLMPPIALHRDEKTKEPEPQPLDSKFLEPSFVKAPADRTYRQFAEALDKEL